MHLIHDSRPSRKRESAKPLGQEITLEELEALYVSAERDVSATRAVSARTRPWVMINMVSSIDGATAVDGLSGGLGTAADRAAFSIIRSVPDIILVASGTAIAEDYQPVQSTPPRQQARVARGQQPNARLAIVTGSLSIDLDTALFRDSDEPPIIITGEQVAAPRLERAQAMTDVILAGAGRVDLALALGELAARGAGIVLCEGGPSLNGQMLGEDLVDEMCMTVAPTLIGGDSSRIIRGASAPALPMTLAHVVQDDGSLLLRYVRQQS